MNTTDIIRDLCSKKSISVTELEKELGFSNGSLTKNNYIRSDRLKIIADYFNVSMEYLLTGKQFENVNMDFLVNLDDKTKLFIELYQNADPDIQRVVDTVLKSAQHKS